MGDINKDVEAMRRIHATSEDKLEIMADLNDLIISVFKKKIKKENPKITGARAMRLLRKALYHDRRDNHPV